MSPLPPAKDLLRTPSRLKISCEDLKILKQSRGEVQGLLSDFSTLTSRAFLFVLARA